MYQRKQSVFNYQRLIWLSRLIVERPVRHWVGRYNITPDAQPIMETHPDIQGFYMAIGFGGQGFMLAPITGHLMAELMLEEKTSLPINRIEVGRFDRGGLVFEPSVI
jgi:sarcosine oxidase subunit beta